MEKFTRTILTAMFIFFVATSVNAKQLEEPFHTQAAGGWMVLTDKNNPDAYGSQGLKYNPEDVAPYEFDRDYPNHATYAWGGRIEKDKTVNNLQWQNFQWAPSGDTPVLRVLQPQKGGYVITNFSNAVGELESLEDLKVIKLDSRRNLGAIDPDIRFLVRSQANEWWASAAVPGPDVDLIVNDHMWYPLVDNAPIEDHFVTEGTTRFESIAISDTATAWADTGITTMTGAGVYFNESTTNEDYQFLNMIWTNVGPAIVEDVRGGTVEEAKATLEAQGFQVEVSAPRNHDEAAAGIVVVQFPAQGSAQDPSTTITIAASAGPDQAWVYNTAGPNDLGTAANYIATGEDVDGIDAIIDANNTIDRDERVQLLNGGVATVAKDTTVTVAQVILAGGSSLVIEGELALNNTEKQNGLNLADANAPNLQDWNTLNIGAAVRAGIDPVAEVTVNGGSITDQANSTELPRANIEIGFGALQYADANDVNETTPSTGTLTVTHGTIDIDFYINVGNAGNEAVGTLILAGNTWVKAGDLNLRNGTLKIVCDVNNPPYDLPYVEVTGSVNFSGGELIIDLSAMENLGTGILLMESKGVYPSNTINDVADVIANATIIPAEGTTADQWSLEIVNTDLGDNKQLLLNLDAN